MQGASHSYENKWHEGVMNLLNRADVCCLQECGRLPNSAKLAHHQYCEIPDLEYWTWGTSRATKYILFYPWDAYGNRCNLAIVSKTPPLSGTLVTPGMAPAWRPALGFQINANTYIFSIHAISGGGADVNGLLGAINGAMGGMINAWIACGDYNRAPNSFITPHFVCPPNVSTFSVLNPGAKYDYCVRNTVGAVTGIAQSLFLSDHYAVEFTI